MRLKLFLPAVAMLSASFAAHASSIAVNFGGLVGDLGGTLSGSLGYDNAVAAADGYYPLQSLSIYESGGLNVGVPFPVLPSEGSSGGAVSPATVNAVPEFTGTALVGPLNFSYYAGYGSTLFFDFSFYAQLGAVGVLSNPTNNNASENFSLAPVDYLTTSTSSVVSVTPEPSSFALLGTGLLGMVGVVRRRIS